MKKFLAILLAVLMTASLSVVGMAGVVEPTGYMIMMPGLDTSKKYDPSVISDLEIIPTIRVGESLQLSLYHFVYNNHPEGGNYDPNGTDSYSFTLYNGKAEWVSEDTDILTVSDTGLVTAVGTGNWKGGVAKVELRAYGSPNEGCFPCVVRVLAADAPAISTELENAQFYALPSNVKPGTPAYSVIYKRDNLKLGDTLQLAVYYCKDSDSPLYRYNGEVTWKTFNKELEKNVTVSDTGFLTITSLEGLKFNNNKASVTISIDVPVSNHRDNVRGYGFNILQDGAAEDPTPDTPRPPVVDSGDDHDEPPATENAANDGKTLDKLAAGESAEVKLTSGSAALATDTMDTLGSHGGKLTVTVDKMTVAIPGGFGKVNEPGRIYYPMDFSASLANAADLAAPVKGEKAKTEVVKAGGDMVMPTTVTVTLKTKLTGTVNVYYYNPETRRYTLLASPTAKDGTITFATKQMGTMVLTTGTI